MSMIQWLKNYLLPLLQLLLVSLNALIGVIKCAMKDFVGRSAGLRQKIFEVLHQSHLEGHSGQQGHCHGVHRRIAFFKAQKHYFGHSGQQGSKQLYSSYHPQSDGQTELLNRCLETYLRAMGHNWADRQTMLQNLRENLHQTQVHMKFFADRHHTNRELKERDLVYLKLQPYRQTSVEVYKNLKLSAKYYGPYKVIKRIRSVAYHLELPQGSQIHPVFRVSRFPFSSSLLLL
ncbi:hypothetical protein KY289_001043 [Solanum tuberosum]|nr:hypothetical protein KY289_001043 [Solanum tuberosum]